ncbi:MAG: hypothetical protein M3O50_21270 [Myxococcota bacterium]|nr:hypothetical protein [Myxococcota bacterium]
MSLIRGGPLVAAITVLAATASLPGRSIAAPSTTNTTNTTNTTTTTKKECVEANESAQDLRRENKLRDARARLAVCLAASCPGPVREDCAHRLAEVDAATPTLVLVATDATGNDLSTVHVTMDGRPFAEKLDGKAIPVDPGEHRFVFEAVGLPSAQNTIVVREGEKERRVKLVLSPPPAPIEIVVPPAPVTTSEPGKTQRLVGLTLGGAGIAGLITGGVFVLVGKLTFDNAQKSCTGFSNCTDPNAPADSRTAKTDMDVYAPIAFAAGGALLAAGGIVYFTAPKEGSVNMGLAVYSPGRGAGLGLQGSW